MPMMPARNLIVEHLGRKVRFECKGVTITGVLRMYAHEADVFEERRLLDAEPSYVLGRVETRVQVLGLDQTFRFPHDAAPLTLMP